MAYRNDNVFFDLTDTSPTHLRVAVDKLGAHRIMFGTDWAVPMQHFAYDLGFKIIRGAKLSPDEWEWIAWRTANELYRLDLSEPKGMPEPDLPKAGEVDPD